MNRQSGIKKIAEFYVGDEKYCVVRTPGGCSTMPEWEYMWLWGRFNTRKWRKSA